MSAPEQAAAAPAASRRIHAPSSWPRAGMVALICAVVVTIIVLAFTWPTKTQEAKDLPITVAGRGSACLNLASRHVRRLPASSISLLQSLAEQFGLAIERLVAREDAQNHRQNLQGFFHALQDFVFVLNDLGEIQYVNPAVHAKLGYDDKLLGKSILAVHPERVHASAWMIVTDMLQGKRTSCPLPILRADGSICSTSSGAVIFGASAGLSPVRYG